MDIDHLTQEEREKHYREGRCFNCHQVGHLAKQCSRYKNKGKAPGPTRARVTDIPEDEDDATTTASTSTQASSSSNKNLVAACIHLVLKDLKDLNEQKEVLMDVMAEGF